MRTCNLIVFFFTYNFDHFESLPVHNLIETLFIRSCKMIIYYIFISWDESPFIRLYLSRMHHLWIPSFLSCNLFLSLHEESLACSVHKHMRSRSPWCVMLSSSVVRLCVRACAWVCACLSVCVTGFVSVHLCLLCFVLLCVPPSLSLSPWLHRESSHDTGCKSLSSNSIAGPEIRRTCSHVCIHITRSCPSFTGQLPCGDVINLVRT